jgi:hypothetical protein
VINYVEKGDEEGFGGGILKMTGESVVSNYIYSSPLGMRSFCMRHQVIW